MVNEEKFEVRCVKVGKTESETDDKETTVYRAEYSIEKANEDWVKIVVTSNQPLKALVGDDVKFVKTGMQLTIMESISKSQTTKPEIEDEDLT